MKRISVLIVIQGNANVFLSDATYRPHCTHLRQTFFCNEKREASCMWDSFLNSSSLWNPKRDLQNFLESKQNVHNQAIRMKQMWRLIHEHELSLWNPTTFKTAFALTNDILSIDTCFSSASNFYTKLVSPLLVYQNVSRAVSRQQWFEIFTRSMEKDTSSIHSLQQIR